MVCPFYNRETEGGCTFKVRGAKLWNRIPLDMRKKDTAGAFKNALKKTFFSLVLLGMFPHFYILVYISLFLSYSIFNSLFF